MAEEIFRRYEKKYMLTRVQYEALLSELEKKMNLDEYGSYRISNIYFDTPDYALIRASIEGPAYKEKLRLRAYGDVNVDSTAFVELKKKYDGVVYKRRVQMEIGEADDYLCRGRYPVRDSQILREIDYTLTRWGLEPAVYISYDRNAFFSVEQQELRVTFDRNIRCRTEGLDLQSGAYGTSLLAEDELLMEVKIPGAVPLWMSGLFSRLKIYPVNFSKYGTYYKEYICRDYIEKGGEICA